MSGSWGWRQVVDRQWLIEVKVVGSKEGSWCPLESGWSGSAAGQPARSTAMIGPLPNH